MVGCSDPPGKERKQVFEQSSIVVLFKVTVKFFYFFFFFPQQLHSSVRTGNLETCLRLLTLGAQANFFHPVRPSVFKSIISVFLHVVFFFCQILAHVLAFVMLIIVLGRKREALLCM